MRVAFLSSCSKMQSEKCYENFRWKHCSRILCPNCGESRQFFVHCRPTIFVFLWERGPGTDCTGGWVGRRAGTENLARTGTVQPVASRYTAWAILVAHFHLVIICFPFPICCHNLISSCVNKSTMGLFVSVFQLAYVWLSNLPCSFVGMFWMMYFVLRLLGCSRWKWYFAPTLGNKTTTQRRAAWNKSTRWCI
jgi:hypothetical protein